MPFRLAQVEHLAQGLTHSGRHRKPVGALVVTEAKVDLALSLQLVAVAVAEITGSLVRRVDLAAVARVAVPAVRKDQMQLPLDGRASSQQVELERKAAAVELVELGLRAAALERVARV